MDSNALAVEREVLRWPGVTSEPEGSAPPRSATGSARSGTSTATG